MQLSSIIELCKVPSPPWVVMHKDQQEWEFPFLYAGTEPEVRAMTEDPLPWTQHPVSKRGMQVTKLRGAKMRTHPDLMNEFGAALQFFDGFGENWPALDELLCWMDEWLPAERYILVVTNADLLLRDEPGELDTFITLLKRVGEWWAKPIVDNPPYNRPARPFHTVLRLPPSTPRVTLERLVGLGVK